MKKRRPDAKRTKHAGMRKLVFSEGERARMRRAKRLRNMRVSRDVARFKLHVLSGRLTLAEGAQAVLCAELAESYKREEKARARLDRVQERHERLKWMTFVALVALTFWL